MNFILQSITQNDIEENYQICKYEDYYIFKGLLRYISQIV